MSYVNSELQAFAKKLSSAMQVGDTWEGTYLGFDQEYDERYAKQKAALKIKFDNGQVKTIKTSSAKVLLKFAAVMPGSYVRIVKLGENTKTDFGITVLKEPTAPAQVDRAIEPAPANAAVPSTPATETAQENSAAVVSF